MKHILFTFLLALLAIPAAAQYEVSFYRVDTVGEVNHAVNATISVNNSSGSTLEGSRWKAYLLAGGQVVDSVAPINIYDGYYANFDVAFTPHEEGTLPLQAVAIIDNDTIRTNIVDAVISKEAPEAVYEVGTPDGTQTYAPLQTSYENSESETVYTADELGLQPGQKITKLVYRGESDYGIELNSLKVWLQNTDATEPADTFLTTDSMTAVYDSAYTIPVGGDYNAYVDLLTLPLQQPFTYTGGNLRVRLRHSASKYSTVYFIRSSSDGNAIYHRAINADDLDAARVNTTYKPVVTLYVESEPVAITGKVSDTDGNALSGAEVKLTSSNVEYSGASADDGSYSIEVIQNRLPYVLTASLKGYIPVADSVNFADGNIVRNIVLRQANGLDLSSASLPAEGHVNGSYNAIVTVTNYTDEAVAGNDWTAALLTADGDTLATTAGVDVAVGESKDVVLSFIPHATDSLRLVAAISGDGFEALSDTASVVILPEEPDMSEKQVNESNRTDYYIPLDLYSYHSTSQTIYNADQIGLPAGSRITSFVYRGYNNNDNEFDLRVRLFVENTTDSLPADNYDFTPADTATMQKLFDGMVHMERKGSRYEYVDMLPLKFGKPFVYEGKNLRVVVVHDADEKSSAAYFENDSHYTTFRASNDYDSEFTASNYMAKNMQPVIHLTVDESRHLTGVVTDSATSEPIAGAVVTLTDNGVIYTDTTASDGSYSINVMKGLHSYQPSAFADGYNAWSGDSLSLVLNDSTLNIVLAKTDVDGIANINADSSKTINANHGIYDLQGRLVAREPSAAAIARLPKGIYIVNGKKVAR